MVLALLSPVLAACGGQIRTAPAKRAGTLKTTNAHSATGSGSGILGFGQAAAPAQYALIVRTLHGYLAAEAAGNGPRTCSYLIPALRAQAAGSSPSCAAALRTALAHRPPGLRAALRATHVAAVRVDGVRAFVVFHQPGVRQAFFPLFRYHGAWKLGATGLTVLP